MLKRNSVQVRWTTLLKDAYLLSWGWASPKAFMFWNSFLPILCTFSWSYFSRLFMPLLPFFLSHALMSICLEKWLITKFLYYPDTWIKYSRKTFIFIMIIHFHFFYLHFVASCTKKSEKVFPHNCCRECRTICLGHPVSSILW